MRTGANYTLVLNGGFNNGSGASLLTSWSSYINSSSNSLPTRYLGLGFATNAMTAQTQVLEDIPASLLKVPYSAAANSPAAKGTLPDGAGDALRLAELFPAVTKPGGGTVVPSSWSYQLVAGAAPVNAVADPLQRRAGGPGSIIFKGQPSFSYTENPAQQTLLGTVVDLHLGFGTGSAPNSSAGTIALADWLTNIEGRNLAGLKRQLDRGRPDWRGRPGSDAGGDRASPGRVRQRA